MISRRYTMIGSVSIALPALMGGWASIGHGSAVHTLAVDARPEFASEWRDAIAAAARWLQWAKAAELSSARRADTPGYIRLRETIADLVVDLSRMEMPGRLHQLLGAFDAALPVRPAPPGAPLWLEANQALRLALISRAETFTESNMQVALAPLWLEVSGRYEVYINPLHCITCWRWRLETGL